jgi:CRP-like cAMP-binding protein
MHTNPVVLSSLTISDAARSDGASARDWAPLIATVPLFSELSARHVRKLAGLATRRRVHAHTRIVRQGEAGNAFFVILEGAAEVRIDPPVPLTQGQYFGELALLDGGPRTATVVASEETLLLEIPRTRFAKLVRDEPTIAAALLKELAGRLRGSSL